MTDLSSGKYYYTEEGIVIDYEMENNQTLSICGYKESVAIKGFVGKQKIIIDAEMKHG